MFTGIITNTTEVLKSRKTAGGLVVTLKKPSSWTDLELGESINTDGVCLTVDAIRPTQYDCVLMPETLEVTTFGKKLPKVFNLERALRAGDRLGGHFVQGHVDCVGKVTKVRKDKGYWLDINFPVKYQIYLADKGSVTINGVSLTVVGLQKSSFSVSLVDYTLKHTALGSLKAGDEINLEFDMIAKHIAQLINRK